jgi:hypothetical protein
VPGELVARDGAENESNQRQDDATDDIEHVLSPFWEMVAWRLPQ